MTIKSIVENSGAQYFFVIILNFIFNPQAIGKDSWVHFSLSNFFSESFTANKFKNVTKVNLSFLALIFISSLDHKCETSMKITSS